MAPLQLLLVILPLGLDTLGVSLSLGIKSFARSASDQREKRLILPYWLRSAILFSLAEMLMPIVGLAVGYTVSLRISNGMHYVGAALLIIIGTWELWEEGREYLHKKQRHNRESLRSPSEPKRLEARGNERFLWKRQLLLALSVSMDELAIGFSLGSITAGKAISPLLLCLLIGLQGFILTVVGLFLGRTARTRLKPLQEASELLRS